jgi:hypothetical protein
MQDLDAENATEVAVYFIGIQSIDCYRLTTKNA